jgi:hypothetical protein
MSRKSVLGIVAGRRLRQFGPIATVGDVEVFPIRGAEDDDDSASGTGGDDDDDDDGAGGDGDGDDDDDSADAGKKTGNRDLDKAVRQAIQRKEALRAKEAELAAAQEKLRQLENKDKTELEKLQSDYSVLEKERDTWKQKHDDLLQAGATHTIELEALKASPKLKVEWRDIDDVLTWLGKQESVVVEEDGSVKGVEAALKALVKAKPHWVKDSKDGGSGAGGSSGGNIGGGRGSGKGDANRSKLEQKYPAMTRNRT